MGHCGSKTIPLTPTPPKPTSPPKPTPPPPPSPPPKDPTPPPRENTEDFSSDHIDVKIDQGSDQIKIEDGLVGYPAPSPPKQDGGQIKKKKNIWFEDDEFNLASDDADLFDLEAGIDDDTVDDDLDDRTITPSQTRRSACPVIKYDKIDEHAKNAGADVRVSFELLLQYLSKDISHNRYEKVLLARAIIVWMSAQSIDDGNYGEANRDSPNGLLQSLKNKTMTYTTCFAILCRKANLQCVKIKGYVKAAGYEPGDTDIPETSWNAVYVETGWQIIHPYWICRALYGHNLGGWVKVEKDGQSMRTKEKASDGIVRNTFQDRYFMPDPEEFLYECCAKTPAWQLVKDTIPSKEDFAKMPYLLPPFFGVGLTLTSKRSCQLDSVDGFCKIELKGSPANAHMLVLRYELFYKSEDSDKQEDEEQQSRMVFNARAGDLFTFDLRFVSTGIYKLVVYGGPHKSPALRLFETKLNCERTLAGRNLLPLSCPKVGWGPGPFSREAGLLMPSRINGLVGVSKSVVTELLFHLQDSKTIYSAVIHGEVDGRIKTFDNSIAIDKSDRDKLLKITATIPEEGEYGLAISVGSKEKRNVCNYLLSTYAFTGTRANVKIAKKKLHDAVMNEVDPSQWSKKIDDIEDCLSKCEKQRIPGTDEDIIVANDELSHLRCRNLLRDCELRRNLDVVRKTLSRVYRYKNKTLLQKEIEKVQRLEQTLIELHGHAAVPNLKEASHRIANLYHRPTEVESILEAVFILTGVSKTSTYDWNSMIVHLKRNRTSLIEQMSRLKATDIPKDRKQKVRNILKKFKDTDVKAVNVDAYSFYEWITRIVETT